jgi:hypothetical protein
MFGQPAHIEAQTTEDINLTKLVPCPLAMNIILDFIYTSQVQLSEKLVRGKTLWREESFH